MYDSYWEFHDLAPHRQRFELNPEDEEFAQDIFDHLSLENDLGQTQFFPLDNKVSRSSSLPDQLPNILECTNDTPNVSAEGFIPNREPEEYSSIMLAREELRIVEAVEGHPLQGETPPFTAVESQQTLCQEPIDLTRLLNRCEDSVELLTEVRAAPSPFPFIADPPC